jgi:agmatinase
MTKHEKIQAFDPSQPGISGGNLFGLPFTADESDIVILPVPWEVTVSYGGGASEGPEAILEASYQVDLHHQEFPGLWKLGLHLDLSEHTTRWGSDSVKYKATAQTIIEALENGQVIETDAQLQDDLDTVNQACRNVHDAVRERTQFWLDRGKKVILLGGDHSTPLGYYEAMAARHGSFGILHLDAHMDLRIGYEGFTYSHASIMYNALQLPQVERIVQVGIRDFCKEEVEVAKKAARRVRIYTDSDLKAEGFRGKTWQQQCDEILEELPQKVLLSFDIDALYPWYCPNTGTPVPGGISFEQAAYLISKLGASGREIIGMDLVEVAPGQDDWDGNVGARMLFHMCGVLAASNGLETGRPIDFRSL